MNKPIINRFRFEPIPFWRYALQDRSSQRFFGGFWPDADAHLTATPHPACWTDSPRQYWETDDYDEALIEASVIANLHPERTIEIVTVVHA